MKRPPKKWLARAVKNFKSDPKIGDPLAMAAWVWHYGLSWQDKRSAIKNEREMNGGKKMLWGLPAKYAKHGFARGWKLYKNAMKKGKVKSPVLKGDAMDGRKRRARRRGRGVLGFDGDYGIGGRSRRRSGRKMRSRRVAPFRGENAYYGFEGRRRRRSRRLSGDLMGVDKMQRGNFVPAIIASGAAAGGGILGVILGKNVPIKDPRIKALIPVLGGMLLAMFMGKNKNIQSAALGMSAIGGVALARALMPTNSMLSGDLGADAPAQITARDISAAVGSGVITPEEGRVLIESGQYMGSPVDFSGETEETEYTNIEGENDTESVWAE